MHALLPPKLRKSSLLTKELSEYSVCSFCFWESIFFKHPNISLIYVNELSIKKLIRRKQENLIHCLNLFYTSNSEAWRLVSNRTPTSAKGSRASSMFRRNVKNKYCLQLLNVYTKVKWNHILNCKKLVESNFLSNYSSFTSEIYVNVTLALCLHVYNFVYL